MRTKVERAQSLILLILDYDVCVSELNENLLNKVQRLQNLSIRLIHCEIRLGLRKFDHVSDRKRLQWLPIKLRREEHVLSLLYFGTV